MQLGLENKKQTTWAIVLGVLAIIAVAYEFIPMFMGSSTDPGSNAQAAAPVADALPRLAAVPKTGKKPKVENLDPTLRLDLLASSEQTMYEGNGRNIFVSQAEVTIPAPVAPGVLEAQKAAGYQTPTPPAAAADSAEVLRIRQPARRSRRRYFSRRAKTSGWRVKARL